MLTHEDVEEILRLLEATPIDEFELETEHFKLTLRRASSGGWTQERQTRRTPDLLRSTSSAAPEATPNSVRATMAPAPDGQLEVRAPLLGTFYRAPKPGAAPFVDLGALVTTDTVVAIIETMKLMNSVYAGASGRVVDICIDDGSFVEQDQVLMRLGPSAA
jgi:acetyl-CoA carboxylase biotin carboxyl carrier protein